MSQKGRNAVVTGGSRGVGAQVCLDLAKEGANILFNYNSDSSKSKADEVVKSLEKEGVKVKAVQIDVSKGDCGTKLLQAAQDFFGNDFKLHILIHNAGTSINADLQQITPEGFESQININLRAPVFITQALQPYMAKHDNGRIIIISSISARLGDATKGVYAASKLGVEAFAGTWKNEFGTRDGITINCVEPGPVSTDMWHANTAEFKAGFDQNLIATTKEISDLIIMLCDAKARWVSGSIVNASCGFHRMI